MTDTLFADVSYFQASVDDSYPYEVLSIRSNDGTFEDPNFAHNYAWCANACDTGKLACFIVYCYWRSNWAATANTLQSMVESAGGPHPNMIVMLDVESGGNPGGDQSDGINRAYWQFSDWLGNPLRVIGYANSGDFYSMWPTRPDGLRVIGAGYGENPNLPGQIAHQYTDGQYGANQGLPMGASPFGNCDMNSADGLSPTDFAAACGIGTTTSTNNGAISMADAQSIQNNDDGVDANGNPLPWRLVHMLRDAQIGDLSTQTDGDAEVSNASPSVYDQVATLAKILTRKYNGKDLWDMVAEIHSAVVK